MAWTAEVESRAPNLKRLAPHRAGRAGGKGPDDESAMLAKKVSLKSKSKSEESEFQLNNVINPCKLQFAVNRGRDHIQ